MLDSASALEVLRDGEIEIVGRIIGSSNNALFVTLTLPCPDPGEPPRVLEAIHKPTIGERPLDDFPDGTLTRREVAAYLVSETSGWDVVPPTLLRDGPFGEGMVQAFIEPDPTVDVIAWIKQQARELVAPQVAEIMERDPRPFFQPIVDLDSPQIVFGRVALLGDAAFVGRPHPGAGTTKGALDAAMLADSIAAHGLGAGLALYQRRQRAFGSGIVLAAHGAGGRRHAAEHEDEDADHLPDRHSGHGDVSDGRGGVR